MKSYQIARKVKDSCPNCSKKERLRFVFMAYLIIFCGRCGIVEENNDMEEVEREVSKTG